MGQVIGEIIEVSSTGFVAQCLESPERDEIGFVEPPAFGAFVKIGAVDPPREPAAPVVTESDDVDPFVTKPLLRFAPDPDKHLAPNLMIALVSHAQTTSLAAGRRPTALRLDSEQAMRAQYPQVFELLTTEFTGLLIGYTDRDGRIRRYLPPRPPKIHSRVELCDADEILSLTANLSFLRFVLAMGQGMGGQVPTDTLVGACIRSASEARGGDIEFVEAAGRTLLPLLGDDYQRLQGIIEGAIG